MNAPAIRVWLEPEYDYGRVGAWMLGWPGCFAWGPTRDAALARVPAAVHGFLEWLAEHGDPLSDEIRDDVEVVEEVPAERSGRYERNATFAADARAVTADELDSVVRRLAYARRDLRAVWGRVRALESDGTMLAVEERDEDAAAAGAENGRAAEDVLRHVAGAEVWLASRLDREARYPGPSRDGDLEPFLDAAREWAVARLRALWERDPGLAGVDGKGETWTLAKVLRRLLYHSLDHLDELDRRLALSERRADRLELRRNAAIDPAALVRLLRTAGIGRRAALGDERLRRMVAGSTETVSAWDGDRLVGFARLISDEATNGYVSTVAVAPRWQNRGLGTRVMRALMEGRDELKLVLEARPGSERFYERLGFGPASNAMTRKRIR